MHDYSTSLAIQQAIKLINSNPRLAALMRDIEARERQAEAQQGTRIEAPVNPRTVAPANEDPIDNAEIEALLGDLELSDTSANDAVLDAAEEDAIEAVAALDDK